ncbi:succinylglutamate desuccinylase/aspartoacylase family protein [Halorientalis sp. IM1011]|uniref:succinylglutamate desuccinylase/aspartoacylase domain-containing protein n=1 Tax=Halorientalis sp. IM1011 TaxID=1932360 RepID=UPI0015608A1D|nr:succinylglutamate desuccinylase/aspartoacylase family protein [Halorientalis sp. IM1011]
MFGADVTPATTILGPGADADVAIVGGIHGDEPSGVRAVRRVIESNPSFQRPVKLVIANPPAVASHRRYLDVDMNRVFPGDPASPDQERRLAAATLKEINDCSVVLSLHSTHSYDDPIALVSRSNPPVQGLAARLPVSHIVDPTPCFDGAFPACAPVVSVEAGRQLTEEATENATDIVAAFLRLTDALPGEVPTTDSTYYTVTDAVSKQPDTDYELQIENFEVVEPGTTVARSEDREYVADDAFVPILMSETGYDDILGYKGETAGTSLSSARATWGVPPRSSD